MAEYADVIFWAVALVAFLIIEGATAQLVTIWFAAGALASLLAGIFKAPVWLEFVLFVAVSAVMLAVTRPLVRKMTKKNAQATNADRCIGEIAVVTEKIDNINGSGTVKVNGIQWTARSSDGSIIEAGENVIVEKIEGVKLIVKEN